MPERFVTIYPIVEGLQPRILTGLLALIEDNDPNHPPSKIVTPN
jgi:hypothetical protein